MPIVLKFEDSDFCYMINQNRDKNYEAFTGVLNGNILNVIKPVNIKSVHSTSARTMFMLDDGELDIESGRNFYVPYLEIEESHIDDIKLKLNQINDKRLLFNYQTRSQNCNSSNTTSN